MTRRIVLSLAVAIALGGCGGSSAPSLSSFKTGFAAQKKQFTQLGRDLQSAIVTARGKSDAQIATEFSSLSTRSSQQGSELRKLNPPSQYKSRLNQLASGFEGVSSDLASIARASASHNSAEVRAAAQKLVQGARSVKAADQSISTGLGIK